MIRVRSYVSKSAINGLGLFAAEPIRKSTLIWSFEENFDRRYTEEEYQSLSQSVKDYLSVYGYKYVRDGYYYMPADNDRFVNHADEANTYDAEDGNVYASRDIRTNEEITLNYEQFDSYWVEKIIPLKVKTVAL